MPQYFPYLVDANDQLVSPQSELALAFAQAMQKREDTSIPFVRRSTEAPTAIARISWPLLMRRAFAVDRFLFSDLAGIIGERMTLPAQPDFNLTEDYLELHEDDSFNNDALRLAEKCATMEPMLYESYLVTLFSGLGDILQRERSLPNNETWGASLPITEEQVQKVLDEQDTLLSWLPRFNEEQDKMDKLLKTLREVGARRIEYYEMQKSKALQLLNEEISTLEPQVNQQLGDLKQQQALLQQQKNALQARFAELEEQISGFQAEVQRYQGSSQRMVDFYNERILRTRDEMRYLSDQQSQNEESVMEEMSARSLLVRRPLSILEQQRQQAERQWQQAINSERELIKTLNSILQEAKLSLQQATKELLGRSQTVAPELPDEMRLELPFVIVRLQSVTTSRYLVLPPATLRQTGQISSFLTDLVRVVRLPLSSRGPTWEEMAKMIEDRLNKQQMPDWFYELLQENNLLQADDSPAQIEAGIAELKVGGFLTERTTEQLVAQVKETFKGEEA